MEIGITTAYVSAAYQIANPNTAAQSVTKYYAGGAMRVNGTVYYALSDHISSTSLTLDASGSKIAEMRYKAWGEVRYANGNLQTDRTYTGQRSYSDDFGLMFYNARWYDSSIGHFAQSDNIEVKAGDTQSLDRFGYVGNNPIKNTDPTGHKYPDPHGCMRYGCPIWNYSNVPPIVKGIIDILFNSHLFAGGFLSADTATSTIRGPSGIGMIMGMGTDLSFPELPGGDAAAPTSAGASENPYPAPSQEEVLAGVQQQNGEFPTNLPEGAKAPYVYRLNDKGDIKGFACYNCETGKAEYRVDILQATELQHGVYGPHLHEAKWNLEFNGWGSKLFKNLFPFQWP
jgi:RHS repeat-associated protein